MKLTLRYSSFLIVLDAVELWWKAKDMHLQFHVSGIDQHEIAVLQALLKGTLLPDLIGTNDPSCCYAIDVIIEDRGEETIFKQFSWLKMESSSSQLRVKGIYRG